MRADQSAGGRLTYQNRLQNKIAQTATHLYLLPAVPLRPFVAHYTLCLGEGPAAETQSFPPLTIFPDASGCFTFTLVGDALEGRLYGPSSRAARVSNDLGVCPLRFFVEFRPGGLSAFTETPLWELTDLVLPLDEGAKDLDQLVQDCWRRAEDLDHFVAAVDRTLCVRLRGNPAFSGLLARFLAGGQSLERLSEETGYSARHLSRLFRERCGLSPKGLQRVLRVNAAARLMQQPGECSLTRLAQELGYFDQAHFIHDFQSVCGVTPGTYRAGLSDFYNEPLKF